MVDRREILIPVANGKSHERRHPFTVASGNRRVGCLISEAPAHGCVRQPKSRVFDIGVGAQGYVDRREILIHFRTKRSGVLIHLRTSVAALILFRDHSTSRTCKIIRNCIQNHKLLISKTRTSNLVEGIFTLVGRRFSCCSKGANDQAVIDSIPAWLHYSHIINRDINP